MILYKYSKEKFCLGHSQERRKMLRRRASCFTVIVSLQFLVQSLILRCIINFFFLNDNTAHNTADCTLPFSLGVVVAVAQHNHIKKKMDRKRVDDNNQNGRPERCETHWSHWCPLLTTMLEYESSLSSEKINSVYCKLTRKPSVTTLSVKTKIMVTTTVSKAPEIIQFSS